MSDLSSLSEIFDKYETDKNSSFHNYGRQYESVFRAYRQKPVSILELGVYRGGSLPIWREAFPQAVHIVGIDIDESCKQYEDTPNHIWVEIGDAADSEFVKRVHETYGPFDIILDDASHTNRDVILSFETLFPLLRDGGVYVVEDTITYKSESYLDPHFPNHLDYFARFLPFLNQWRYDSETGTRDNCVDPFKIEKKTDNIFEATIDKIVFGCSFIAVSKQTRHHWL